MAVNFEDSQKNLNIEVSDLAVGTDGELITWDSSGNPTTVSVGTSGHVLTSNGAGSAPTFQAAAGGGGKVLQVVQSTKTDTASINSTTAASTGLSATITPSATSSKILVIISTNIGGQSQSSGNYLCYLHLRRGASTDIIEGDAASNRIQFTTGASPGYYGEDQANVGFSYLDSPSTTSATTYYLYWQSRSASGASYMNRSYDDTDLSDHGRAASTMILMEIDGS